MDRVSRPTELPVTDQRSTMAATATRWLLPAVDHDHLAVDGVSRELELLPSSSDQL